MRLSLRVLGLDLFDLELTTDEDNSSEDTTAAPITFGFHGSGAGLIERQADEATEFDGYDRT